MSMIMGSPKNTPSNEWYNKNGPHGAGQGAAFDTSSAGASIMTKKRMMGAFAAGVFIVALSVAVVVVSSKSSGDDADESGGPGDGGGGDTDPLTARECADGLILYLPYAAEAAGGNDKLTRISCSSADMATSIPAAIGLYTELTYLGMDNTGTTGTLPSELGLCSRLTDLTLSNNPLLEGTLPIELGNLSALQRLSVANNGKIVGDLPAGLRAIYDQGLMTFDREGSGMMNMSPTTNAPTAPTSTPTSASIAPTTSSPSKKPTTTAPTTPSPTKKPTTKAPTTPSPTKKPTTTAPTTPSPTKKPTKKPTNMPTMTRVDCAAEGGVEAYWEAEMYNQGGIDSFTHLENCGGFEIPSGISKYTALTFLNIGRSFGTLPKEIGLLTNLERLEISCGFDSYSSSLKEDERMAHTLCTHDYVNTPTAWMTGSLPSQWGNLSALKTLIITDEPELSGSLPSEWAGMSKLTLLSVYRSNKIVGSLPSEWGRGMSSLERVDIIANEALTGVLPPEWSKMGALKHVHVNGNAKLTGHLPPSWGELSKLTSLEIGGFKCLWHNNAGNAGDDPCVNSGFRNTIGADYSGGGYVRGSLPSEWGALGNLKNLVLEHLNGLAEGGIPSEWGNMKNLETASFYNLDAKRALISVPQPFRDLVYCEANKLTVTHWGPYIWHSKISGPCSSE